MSRYKIWDRQETIYTPGREPDVINPQTGEVIKEGRSVFTPEEWIRLFPWAGIPTVKVVVSGGPINGASCDEFEGFVDMFKKRGAPITDGMTDQEILDAIEYFQDNPPPAPPSADERLAAAEEALAMEGLEDAE